MKEIDLTKVSDRKLISNIYTQIELLQVMVKVEIENAKEKLDRLSMVDERIRELNYRLNNRVGYDESNNSGKQ